MSSTKKPAHRHQPIPLLRNIVYPTYQLYAIAGANKNDPAQVLTIAILEACSWLRRRFRNFDVPKELQYPEPDGYAQMSLDALTSFRIDAGYKVEVIWLPEEKIWALQLTEPDLGPDPGAEKQARQPVPGRIFETNIAFRISGNQVHCGFRTLVSDIEGTLVPCEVFRLALIKQLVKNPQVGLQHLWPVSDQTHELDRQNVILRLQNSLAGNDCQLPVVLAVDREPAKPSLQDLPKIEDLIRSIDQQARHPWDWQPGQPAGTSSGPDSQQPLQNSMNVLQLAHDLMGYAHFFQLPTSHIATWNKHAQLPVADGDVWIFEPRAFGGGTRHFSKAQIQADPAGSEATLQALIQNYPKGKPMTFGPIAFVPKAKIMESAQILRLSQSKEEILRASEARLDALSRQQQGELQQRDAIIAQKDLKIRRLDELLEHKDTEKSLLRQELEALTESHDKKLAELQSEIDYLKNRQNRPKELADIIPWVERSFPDALFLHARAKAELAAVKPDEVNLSLLCDALEYLATEYRDELLGYISRDECLNRCTKKYNRGFEVTPLTGTSVEMYPTEYRIKYYPGPKGKPVESLLNLHLKVGVDPRTLIRIYFLYDKEKQLIVVGSLPKHLKTVEQA